MSILNRFSPTRGALLDVPELTTEAVEAARKDPAAGCLLDRVHPHELLLLCFAFRGGNLLHGFDFFGRTKKRELRLGRKFNRILVRDLSNSWYHRGVPGLGGDVDEMVGSLRTLIDAIAPSRVVTIGQSMGGYAAILFGMLLRADRIVSFGPLSHLDPERADREGDRRFVSIMRELRADPPRRVYPDLVQLGRDLEFRGELHVVFGTHPHDDDGVSGNFDAVHALRLAQLPKTTLHPYPGATHTVVQWLIDNGQIDSLLASLLTEADTAAEVAGTPA